MIRVDFGRIDFPLSASAIEKIVRRAARVERKIKGAVEISVIGDGEMKKINQEWRGKKTTTDVLSFAWNEDRHMKSVIIGQIFISYPFVKKQAKEAGAPFMKEFTAVLIHGLLHLVGYDHNDPKKAQKMFKMQDKIACYI